MGTAQWAGQTWALLRASLSGFTWRLLKMCLRWPRVHAAAANPHGVAPPERRGRGLHQPPDPPSGGPDGGPGQWWPGGRTGERLTRRAAPEQLARPNPPSPAGGQFAGERGGCRRGRCACLRRAAAADAPRVCGRCGRCAGGRARVAGRLGAGGRAELAAVAPALGRAAGHVRAAAGGGRRGGRGGRGADQPGAAHRGSGRRDAAARGMREARGATVGSAGVEREWGEGGRCGGVVQRCWALAGLTVLLRRRRAGRLRRGRPGRVVDGAVL
jgi:hypothetical protein